MLKDMVDTFISSGMKDAGHQYFILDDAFCLHLKLLRIGILT
jgi:hypothetical protein